MLIMLKKTIEYENYNGETVTEDFYFNLSKAEILDMEIEYEGSLTEYMNSIVLAKDLNKLMALFKDILHKSYGKKSLDGRRFIKNQEILEEFTQTPAYDELYVKLATDADEAAAFVRGIFPKSMQK